jgi:DNA-binding NarL/FixJ family response regulator
MNPLNVVLAENPSSSPLGGIVRQVPGVQVIAEATDGPTALALIAAVQPDVALVEAALPGMSGYEVAERVVRERPDLPVLILATEPEHPHIARALRTGAAGYLLKQAADRAELEVALRAVARGHAYLSPAVTKPVVEVFVRAAEATEKTGSAFTQLSPRQHQILQLLAEGNSTRAMALHLSLSVKTIETHRAQLMKRLAIRDVPGLVRYAIRAGIVSAER